ncbi:MAG: hypothetical protein K6U89_03135, partial [Chloroflexi bacterium]|nr:hypothetical protein [Chloroflexota bacterium]
LSVYNQKYGRKVQFHPDVMPYFLTYPWPGNIRELQNIVERLVVTDTITEGPESAEAGMPTAGRG